MNYLSGAINYIAGADADSSPTSLVPRLIDRIVNSALPHDRRAAVIELASIARESPQRQAEIGERGVKVIYAVLEQDKEYEDTLRAVLDLLISMCGCLEPPAAGQSLTDLDESNKHTGEQTDHPVGGGSQGPNPSRDAVAAQALEVTATNIDAFLGIPNAMVLLLELLEKQDLFIKCSTLELLTAMAANSRPTIQAAVLAAPQGVALLADLVDDPNQLVRTNAILVLSALTEGSPEICKIVTFSGIIETLFRSMQSLPSSSQSEIRDGDEPEALEAAIVAQDALQLVLNLLSESTTTQSYLRDSGCIPRLCAVLAHAIGQSDITSVSSDSVKSGPARAVAQHQFKNVILVLNCVRSLVRGDPSEASRNKAVCASAGILRIILQVCFGVTNTPDQPERVLLRVNAMLTAAALVRGHEECRNIFMTPIPGLGGQTRSRSPQLLALDIVTNDLSPAMRSAAHRLLTGSLVADPSLDLPATALLNALVSGASDSRDSGATRSGANSPAPSIAAVAAGLKSTVVGWPNEADGAGVFYAACTIGWVALRVRGARERLLGAYVSGTGDTLLARAVRGLGHADRENGPPAVRIGLLRLMCCWLYQSPSAVSAFLSSALHLPLIIELVTKSSPRADVTACQTQGLAALLLAICLECAEEEISCNSESSGFVSGSGGASIVIPRATLADIVRNRIGVASFLSRLDEFRASNPYSEASRSHSDLVSPVALARAEILQANAVEEGNLGHNMWYDNDFTTLVDDVYKKVSGRVLKLISEENSEMGARSQYGYSITTPDDPRSEIDSGSVNSTHRGLSVGGSRPGRSSIIESSSRDEVLVSFKELIRSQDISLNDARLRIQELEACLHEAQAHLDNKLRDSFDHSWLSEREKLTADNVQLAQKMADLESVLADKSREFAALSDAYTALEAERGSSDTDDVLGGNPVIGAELQRLRQEKAALLAQFYAECDKVNRLENMQSDLELDLRRTTAELRAVEGERNSILAGSVGAAEHGDLLEWKRRAESSEAQLHAQDEALKRAKEEADVLRGRVRSVEAIAEEASSTATAATTALAAMTSDNVKFQATRKREIQMVREAAVASERAARDEISALQNELAIVKSTVAAEKESREGTDLENELRVLRMERDDAKSRVEALSVELTDVRNSTAEWQRRAETARLEKEQYLLEHGRLDSVLKDAQRRGEDLQLKLDDLTHEFEIASRKVVDSEEKCSDLEELHRKQAEEITQLKDEVTARSEQTIRLSGTVYEAEEARVLAEASLENVKHELSRLQKENSDRTHEQAASAKSVSANRNEEYEDYIASLNEKILEMKEKISQLEATLAATCSADVKLTKLSSEHSRALLRLKEVEAALAAESKMKNRAEAETQKLQNHIISLKEAEVSKRRLTEEVGELRAALNEASQSTSLGFRSQPSDATDSEQDEKDTLIAALRVRVDEQAMRLKELECSIDTLANGGLESDKCMVDLQKRLEESEALLSVVVKEKKDQIKRVERLENELSSSTKEKEEISARFRDQELELEKHKSSQQVISDDLQTSQISELEEQLSVVRVEAELTCKKLAQMEVELLAAKEKLAADAIHLEKCSHERDDAVRELSALRSAASDADQELTDLRTALSDAAKGFKASAKELSSREELLVALSADKMALVNELAASNETVETLRKDMLRSAESFAAEKVRLVKAITEAEDRRTCGRELAVSCYSNNTGISHGSECSVADGVDAADLSVTYSLVGELETKFSLLELKLKDSEASKRRAEICVEDVTNRLAEAQEEARLTLISHELAVAHAQAAADARVADMIDELESVKRNAHDAITALNALTSSTEADHSRALKDSESRTSELVAKVEHYRAELAGAIAAKDVVLKECIELQKCLEDTTVDRASLQNENSKLTIESSNHVRLIDELESALATSRKSLQDLSSKLETISIERTDLSSRLRDGQELTIELQSELEATRVTFQELEASLRSELNDQHELLRSAQEEVISAKVSSAASDNRSATRIGELEAELQEQNEALEVSERNLRDATSAARQIRTDLEHRVQSLKDETTCLRRSSEEKENQINNLRTVTEQERSSAIEKLGQAHETIAERDACILSLRKEAVAVRENLRCAEDRVGEAEKAVTENIDRVESMRGELVSLQRERDSLLTKVDELENAKSNHVMNIDQLERQFSQLESEFNHCKVELSVECSRNVGLVGDFDCLKAEADRLRDTRARLEDELDATRAKLDSAEVARCSSEKDNEDLRGWVSDLEGQAQGLQAVVSKFEDVERSLDEAVSAHSAAMQANSELTSEIETVRVELAAALSRIRVADAEKISAESARLRAAEQVVDLEGRLHEIRATHLSKLTTNEDMIRSNMTRCVELESALASAERQLAESAMLNDRIYNLEAQVVRVQADAKANLSRAKDAEQEVEALESERARLEMELGLLKGSAGGVAYAELEAEHNELLVCLADLELECAMLKDTTTLAGGTNMTNESVSVR